MGASGWWYRCDHDPDPSAALKALQARVFETGDYHRPWDESPEARAGLVETITEVLGLSPGMAEEMGLDPASLERLAGGAPPATIDDVRLWVADSGSHSILDLSDEVADEPKDFSITALSEADTVALFGSPRPTAAAIAAKEDEAMRQPIHRWTGHYVTAYDTEGDKPTDMFFWGWSGD